MEQPTGHVRSYLFTVRLWQEEVGVEQREWRGKVQLLSSGEVRYFRSWEALAPLLLAMLPMLDADAQEIDGTDNTPDNL
jgi:hypothetical protein